MTYNEIQQKNFYQERVGKVYGCFEVVSVEYDRSEGRQLWTLRCVHCGMTKQTYNGKDYVKGKNKGNCSCQPKESNSKKPQKIKKEQVDRKIKKDHELYGIWCGMISRCCNPNDKDYKNYGGRGISVCDEWRNDFWSFVSWAENNGYRQELTIDRTDNNSGYSPENCRWVHRCMQNKNKRNVPLYDGETLPDICAREDVSYSCVTSMMNAGHDLHDSIEIANQRREKQKFGKLCKSHGKESEDVRYMMKKGMTLDEALSAERIPRGTLVRINGEIKPFLEWCRQYNISPQLVKYRMNVNGMGIYEALTSKKRKRDKKD